MHHYLNNPQRLAVETVKGRLLVLAGAGSGKTGVLTHRIAYLINQLQVSPKSILGLTFTNKAAEEMRQRIAGLVSSSDAKAVTLATFHSFCLQVLRSDIARLGYTERFSLYDEHDVKRVLNYIARDLLDINKEMPSMARAQALINQARSRGRRPEEIVDPHSVWHEQFTRDLHSSFEAALRAYNAVDFDHLLTLCVELFEKHPDILERYQERFRYIMIDEYQDTNPIQYRLAELLSAKYHNLCVVGDDDQSIYGWRGADMRNILDFKDATTIKLEQNYRSTGTILKAANAVIQCNQQRHSKVLWSDHGDGLPIEIFIAPSDVEEASAVVRRIASLKEDVQLAWRDIAILYRSNALSRQLELALNRQPWNDDGRYRMGIPHHVFGGTEFYERKEVKDLFAYLRVIVNPHDQEALLRVINQPRRGIGERGLDLLTSYNRCRGLSLWSVITAICRQDADLETLRKQCTGKFLKGLDAFVAIVEEAKERFACQSLAGAMQWLIARIDYRKAICEEVKSLQMRTFKEENVQEFMNLIAEFEKAEHAPGHLLHDFITTFPLQREGNFKRLDRESEADCVSLMTFHSSKGLEFPACFLVGIEEEIIPHAKSIQETGLEEERRLMYVAITRARRYLTLSLSLRRMKMGEEVRVAPSRFLSEIPAACLRRSDWRGKGCYL